MAALDDGDRGCRFHNLFKDPMVKSAAAKKIQEFTKAWPEPFAPAYPYSNPWANKKDNKGKKDRPASVQIRPGLAKGEVSL